MTIQYTEKGEVNKRDESVEGHEPLRDVPEEEHQEEVARHPGAWDILRLPKHREGGR